MGNIPNAVTAGFQTDYVHLLPGYAAAQVAQKEFCL